MKENAHTFPFFFLDKHEVLDLNEIDLPSHLKLLESYDFKSKLKMNLKLYGQKSRMRKVKILFVLVPTDIQTLT